MKTRHKRRMTGATAAVSPSRHPHAVKHLPFDRLVELRAGDDAPGLEDVTHAHAGEAARFLGVEGARELLPAYQPQVDQVLNRRPCR